jgi:sodium transport system permease protein
MTFLFTRSWLQTLLLDRRPQLTACVAAVLLAVLLQPLGQQLSVWIQWLYPIQDQVLAETQAFGKLLETAPYIWLPFLLMALLPALCEEVAFRGFILSGLRHVGSKWWAIALSAVFFGMAHTVIQQSIAAAALGLVLGYVAVQAGSLVPCILFHAVYNSLMLSTAILPQHWTELANYLPVVESLFSDAGEGILTYRTPVVIGSAILSVTVLMWFHRLPYQATREEELSDARAMQSQQLAPE